MRKAVSPVLIATLSLLIACDSSRDAPLTEKPAEPTSELDELASTLEGLMLQGAVPGAAIALIRPGRYRVSRRVGRGPAGPFPGFVC